MRRIGIPALLLLACVDTSAPTGGTSNPGGAHAGGGVEGGSGGEVALGPSSSGGEGEGGSGGEGGRIGGEYAVSTALISSQHRFIDGAMFGGWGPHLGHLITLGDDVFLVDDICAQPGDASLGACDVNDDHTLGYYRRATDGWSLVTTTTLPGVVQQNTATIASADGSVLHTFGIDVAGEKLQECVFAVPAGPVSCSELPFTLAPSSNYIGAAISPLGHRVVWWTTVVDGGGGGFHYIVDYGGGWNGPRSGDVIGFNDASYINVAFPAAAPARLVMHGQLVAGLAPSWTFTGAIGVADLTTTNPVAWSTPLAAVGGTDAIASTNDIWIDPAADDEHVLARTEAGATAYFHRAAGGSFPAASFVLPSSFRARFVPHGDRLALVYGRAGEGLAYRVAMPSDRLPGQPIDWSTIPETTVALPEGYEDLYAIYPAGPPYQTAPSARVELAIVGATRQFEVLGVTLTPP